MTSSLKKNVQFVTSRGAAKNMKDSDHEPTGDKSS